MKKYINLKIITLFTIILFFVLMYLFFRTFNKLGLGETEIVMSKQAEIKILENSNPINIDEILEKNTQDNIKEEMYYEEIDLEHTTKYIDNDDLPTGTMHVIEIGSDGKQEVITIKRYNNDELESEQIVASNIKRASIDKVVEIGTGKGKNTYKLKENDNVYTTANSLPMMREASKESEKITTLSKATEVTVIEVLDSGWAYVQAPDRTGYVLSEALSNINPNAKENENNVLNELSKEELLGRLDFNMDMSEPSGLSLEQFREILQYNESDKNSIFTDNADYFYYAEQEYGINGVFLAAIAIHESGWGTSNIAKDKNNLFGYMAYDNSPYASAKQFSTCAEGIDLVARVLVKYYLNPAGAEIYGGNIAEGKFYNGNTVTAVNQKYASDKNWANAVYSIMKNLYGNL